MNEKLKNHVSSLEMCKQLNESGYPKNTLWYWAVEMHKGNETDKWSLCPAEHLLEEHPKYPAPLATELLEQLPWRIRDEKSQLDSVLFILPHAESNAVGYKPMHESNTLYEDWNSRNLQDALAWAWLWLKGENRI